MSFRQQLQFLLGLIIIAAIAFGLGLVLSLFFGISKQAHFEMMLVITAAAGIAGLKWPTANTFLRELGNGGFRC